MLWQSPPSRDAHTKVQAKAVASAAGVPVPQGELLSSPSQVPTVPFPYVLKPCREDNSMGLAKAESARGSALGGLFFGSVGRAAAGSRPEVRRARRDALADFRPGRVGRMAQDRRAWQPGESRSISGASAQWRRKRRSQRDARRRSQWHRAVSRLIFLPPLFLCPALPLGLRSFAPRRRSLVVLRWRS